MTKTVEKGNFGEGRISSTIIKLALPIILAEFVHVLYNLVDRMYLGHIPGYGTNALSGVGLVFPIITIINAFANLCSYGGSPLCAIARGEGNDAKAQKILENTFTLCVFSGLTLTVLLLSIGRPLLLLMGADSTTIEYALKYYNVYVTGCVFVLISLGMNSFINMQGYSVIGMWTVLIGAGINIILDPIFIFTFNMGVVGAALATVISQFCSALWVVLFICGKKLPVRFRRFGIDKELTKKILHLGVSGFMFKATNGLTQALVNATLKIWGGSLSTLYIGSMSIINSLREVLQQPVTGIIEGSKPVISYNYGAQKYDRVDKSIKFMVGAALSFNIIGWLLMEFIPRPFVSIFTSDNQLIETCIPCLKIYFVSYFLMTFQTTGQNTFVALNKPKFAVFFSMLRKVFLIVPFTILLPRIGLGVNGVFWAEVVSQVIGASACFTTMFFMVWRPLVKRKLNEEVLH